MVSLTWLPVFVTPRKSPASRLERPPSFSVGLGSQLTLITVFGWFVYGKVPETDSLREDVQMSAWTASTSQFDRLSKTNADSWFQTKSVHRTRLVSIYLTLTTARSWFGHLHLRRSLSEQ